jgi:hypothetical protein
MSMKQPSDIMTGQQLRSYMATLEKEKSPYGPNKFYPDKREAAKQELESFLKSKWRRVEDGSEV